MNSKELLSTLIRDRSITVLQKKRVIKGMARYATVNNAESEYIKVSFTDKSGIYFPLDEDVCFYFDSKLGKAEGISDDVIGKAKKLTWNNEEFHVTNANDYQYVKEFIVGSITDIEGEVRFSDYEDNAGNVLSLGWNMYEESRDDVYAVPLDENAFL